MGIVIPKDFDNNRIWSLPNLRGTINPNSENEPREVYELYVVWNSLRVFQKNLIYKTEERRVLGRLSKKFWKDIVM